MLAVVGEAVWYEMSLRGIRRIQELDTRLPIGLTVEVTNFSTEPENGTGGIPAGLDRIRLRLISANGRQLKLDGLMPAAQISR